MLSQTMHGNQLGVSTESVTYQVNCMPQMCTYHYMPKRLPNTVLIKKLLLKNRTLCMKLLTSCPKLLLSTYISGRICVCRKTTWPKPVLKILSLPLTEYLRYLVCNLLITDMTIAILRSLTYHTYGHDVHPFLRMFSERQTTPGCEQDELHSTFEILNS